jgi:hypothetical protein
MSKNTAFIGFRAPEWMADGIKAVAEKRRVPADSIVLRWALEDLLAREGITEPDAEHTAA